MLDTVLALPAKGGRPAQGVTSNASKPDLWDRMLVLDEHPASLIVEELFDTPHDNTAVLPILIGIIRPIPASNWARNACVCIENNHFGANTPVLC